MTTKRLSPSRFRKLIGPGKDGGPVLHGEIDWLASDDETHIGCVVLGLYDLDYGWVALVRDRAGAYQFDGCATSLLSATEAEAALTSHFEGRQEG